MSPRAQASSDWVLPFPVLEERPLSYIPKKFMRGVKRDLGELPDVQPGTVLVFYHGSRYVAFREDKHLTGSEEPVIDATAVCLVDIRVRQFTVQFQVPSANPADDFTIRTIFQARVTIPERAAEEGPIDIRSYLTAYLERDPRLGKLGTDYPIEGIAEVRDKVIARIEAYCEYNPIDLPGLAIELSSASVLTPHELRIHERQKRDMRRQQEVDEILAEGEDRSIERHKAMLQEGEAALVALGITRGETSINDVIKNTREDDQRRQEHLAEVMRIFQKNGGLDFLDVDPTEIVNAYLEKLTGQPVPRSDRTRLYPGNIERREAIGSSNDDEDDEAPDEADLNE